MILAVEFPIPNLATLSKYTDFDFVLTHMVLGVPKYREFYQKQHRFKILDNSYFELGKSVSGSAIIEAASIVAPNEVIAPDGYKATLKFIKQYGPILDKQNIAIAAVVHGDTLDEFLKNLRTLAQHPQITTLCIPLDLNYLPKNSKVLQDVSETSKKLVSWMYSRLLVLESIQKLELESEKQYHLLGCSLPLEFKIVGERFPWVRSFDTSAPVMTAINKIELDEVTSKLIRPTTYFDKKLAPSVEKRIIKHIQTLKKWGR